MIIFEDTTLYTTGVNVIFMKCYTQENKSKLVLGTHLPYGYVSRKIIASFVINSSN